MGDEQKKPRAVRKARGGVLNRGTKDRPQWYCRYVDVDGTRKTKHTHQPSKELAETFLRNIKANVARGLAGHPKASAEEKQRRALTVADLMRTFLEKYAPPSIKDLPRYRQSAGAAFNRRIEPYPIALRAVAELRPRDVEELRDALAAAGYSPGGVNDALKYLGTAINWGIDREIIPSMRSPVSAIEMMPEEPLRERYSLDEVHKLLRHAPEELLPIVAFSLYTGCRPGETRGLTWDRVHLDAAVPHVRIESSYLAAPKTAGSRRAIPIHAELLPILRAWRDRCPKTEAGLVFPVPQRLAGTGAATGWRMARTDDDYGLPALLRALGCHVPKTRTGLRTRERTWHTCRGTLISALTEAGASGDAISRITGHAGRGSGAAAMTLSYTAVSLEYLARELGRVSFTPPPVAGVTPLRRPAATPAA